jgi:hypothetical protein
MAKTKPENRGRRLGELPEPIYEAPMIFVVWGICPDGFTKSLLKGDRNANGISI